MNAINKAIFDQLAGGTALVAALGGTAIYHMQAPDGAALPYVVYSWAGGGEQNLTPSSGIERVEFVRAYASSAAAAGTIDGLARARLHGQTLSVAGYANIWTAREGDFEAVEVSPNGERTYTAGGNYRIVIT